MTEKYKEIIEALSLYSIEERKEIILAIQGTFDPQQEVIGFLRQHLSSEPMSMNDVKKNFLKVSIGLFKMTHIPLFEDFEFREAITKFMDWLPERYPWYRSQHYYSKQWNSYIGHLIKIVQAGRCLRKQNTN
ncbi:hypothetical protein [Erwinia phage vB_Ea277G]|nr:hypothetical protein [Erwinia phage vB_Ea277G]